MARHAIDSDTAFEILRGHSQHNGRKVADVAAAIIESHRLLGPAPPRPSHLQRRAGGTSAVEPPEAVD
jgi:ANTAR domain